MSWMRPLGDTGLQVSALSLGTVKLGRNQGLKYASNFALPDDRAALELLACAHDLGINLVDTAPAYGTSEERLGRLLQQHPGEWLICTKAGEEFADGHSDFDFSPAAIRLSVQRSLSRLRREMIDIVLLHSNGNDLEIISRGEALGTLEALKKEGLIRAFGMSTKTVAGGSAAAQVCDVIMPTYNLQQQDDAAVLEISRQQGTGTLVKKVLASGSLATAGSTQEDAEGQVRSDKVGRENDDWLTQSMELVLQNAGVSSALVGTLSLKHLESNIQAARAITD